MNADEMQGAYRLGAQVGWHEARPNLDAWEEEDVLEFRAIFGAGQPPSNEGSARQALLSLDPTGKAARLGARGLVDVAANVSLGSSGLLVDFPELPIEVSAFLGRVLGFEGPCPLELGGVPALDAMGKIYGDAGPGRPSRRRLYEDAIRRVLFLSHESERVGVVRVKKVRPEAQVLAKERVSDSGYDLTLVGVHKKMGVVTLFSTGWIVEPPEGWYFDVVPRSSIIKRGYILANNVGIIDRSYRGEILVPLIKVDPDAPDLELPARVAQLIPRPIVHFEVEEVAELSMTSRGAGGFGSTGK